MLNTWPAMRGRIEELGTVLTPDIIAANFRILASLHAADLPPSVRIVREIRYGGHERQVLDVFVPKTSPPKPVLIFVHGGGFVSGDKAVAGTPFHDNVGLWAVGNDLVAVNINYRLAPQYQWPSGAEDVAAAVAWVVRGIAAYGGDAGRIFMMGHSAGAAHVAQALARDELRPHASNIAGAILVSGLYDCTTAEKNPLFTAYFGGDSTLWSERSAVSGLLATAVPLMVAVAEFDPSDFQHQWLGLTTALLERDDSLPRIVQFPHHGHLSTVMTLNTADNQIERPILDFIADCG